jgi:hypothetical protein
MTAEVLATVENGLLKPEAALPFPDQTRVKLTIETVSPESSSLEAWNRLQQIIHQNPIAGIAEKFSRKELHERD